MMKKIFCMIALVFCGSLLPLEKLSLENPHFLTTMLVRLEPPFSLVQRKISTQGKVLDFVFIEKNGFYETVTQPFFSSLHYTITTTCNKTLSNNLKKEYIKSVWINYAQKINAIFSDRFFLPTLLTSLPTIECIIAPIINYAYPNISMQFLFSNNVMIFNARKDVCNFTKYINQDTCRELFAEDKKAEFLLKYGFLTASSILLVTFANYTHSDLFAQFTYFELVQLAWSKGIFLYYMPLSYLKLHPDLTKKIAIQTTYFDYSLFALLTDIETIFEAKKTMFLISILLACVYLKPKNKVFTGPNYWLPIGIAHILFTKCNCSKKLVDATNNRLINYNELSDSSKRTAYFLLKNIVPISAVLINNCIAT